MGDHILHADNQSGIFRFALKFSRSKLGKTLRSSKRRRKIACAFGIVLILLWSKSRLGRVLARPSAYYYTPAARNQYLREGLFERILVPGFCNNGIPGKLTCDRLRCDGNIGVQQSFHLHDDLMQIAEMLGSHPLVDYEGKDSSLPFEQLVDENWARFALSSTWLPDYGVYLAVTRVIYYPTGVLSWPTISFLRGQIFDEEWNNMENYTINWNGDEITFPKIFEIPAFFEKGEAFFGPEDPRIILQDGVQGAEPVIVFNMLLDEPDWPRAMWIHRPFSNFTTALRIRNEDRNIVEKNWAPFFYTGIDQSRDMNQRPSQHLHFIYGFEPLRVLKCQLLNGYCDWVFKEDIPDQLSLHHEDPHGDMRGGTNFVPVPIKTHSGIRAYAGFPRTHLERACGSNPIYRPELVILSGIGSNFHVAYASDAIDFGHMVLDKTGLENPCEEGHILIANSISRWDQSYGQDIMTLSFTVADNTVQVARLSGVMTFIRNLPYFDDLLKHEILQDGDETWWNFRWSAVGKEVLACSVEAASNTSLRDASEAAGKSNETAESIGGDEEEEGWEQGMVREEEVANEELKDVA